MTPHTSHCRRALQRQILSSTDFVWISDRLLAASFERYCRVSKTGHRNAGYVPGPLESRRRLGKRQMGDLNSMQYASSAPPWAFPVPLNLSQWHWEPPKTAAQLQRDNEYQEDHTPTNWLTKLDRWLGELAFPAASQASIIPDPTPSPQIAARESLSLCPELDTFFSLIATAPLNTVRSDAYAVFHKFQHLISLGEMAPEAILSTFTNVWEALDSRFQDTAVGQGLYLALCSAVVSGITTSRVIEPSLLDVSFWNTLLSRMSELAVDDELCALFGQAMESIPAAHLRNVSDGVLAMLGSIFSAWYSSPDLDNAADVPTLLYTAAKHSSRLQQKVEMVRSALAMADINPQEHGPLLKAATRLVLELTINSESEQHAPRYNWLCVLAQMPLVNQDFLLEASALLWYKSPGVQLFTDSELCSLMLFQWESRGYLPRSDFVRSGHDSHRPWEGNTAIASLAVSIYTALSGPNSRHQTAVFYSLWKFLAKLNRTDGVVASIEALSKRNKLPLRLLQALAFTSENHTVAIKLHDLYIHKLQYSGPGGIDWNPAVFEKYVDKIVHDRTLHGNTLWKALDIMMFQKSKDISLLTWRHRGDYGKRRASIVRKSLTLYANAPHLQNREAFRQVAQGVRYLEQSEDGLSPDDVKVLFHVVAKDLKEGKPGRTRRLRWFLRVIERNFGSAIMRGCLRAFSNWRWRLKVNWRLQMQAEAHVVRGSTNGAS
ncbi:hypothetical protein B0H66DRAFT_507017 [Apodospora peruviana]|uniref:Uncharacterized protein n=1 Tax=Apodospora peruviana TaxID=516989 RepID=A0AAE0IR16_9PEZI|nr:hypothetical protein B0H66DRAFT_507017 [Apodospora peruviana]